MPISYHPGSNIVDDDADILVNCVNCVGVMGKGFAKAFAKRWPSIVSPYKQDCTSGRIHVGTCHLYALPEPRRRFWAALVTKDNWRHSSRKEWIEDGLRYLSEIAEEACRSTGIARSIAIPPPGCGNGGLDWREVEPIVLRHLGGFDLRIYGEKTT